LIQKYHKKLETYDLMLRYFAEYHTDEYSLIELLQSAKDSATEEIQSKQGLTKFIAMIQYANQKGCSESHLLLDDIINSPDLELKLGKAELYNQVVVTKVFLLVKQNTKESIEEIKQILRDAAFDISSSPCKTCLAMLWKHGDELATLENYKLAIDYYLIACKLFSSSLADSRNHAIIQRKMAMCHLFLEDSQSARECCLKGN
jgi:hypothetical protein